MSSSDIYRLPLKPTGIYDTYIHIYIYIYIHIHVYILYILYIKVGWLVW